MYRRSWIPLAVSTLLALAACGSPGPTDTDPPTVVTVFPQDGYHGFKRGQAITIGFSEPMDAAATEGAFLLLDPAGAPVAVSFSWEDEGRRLVATPADPVAYSTDASYTNYRLLLSTGAKDKTGNPLAQGLDVTFSTMRTLSLVRDSVPALDGAVASAGFVYNDPNDPSVYTTASTGDTVANKGLRSFFAFDLNSLGITAADVAYAQLTFYNTALIGSPFGPSNLGNLIPERVTYLDDGQLDAGDYVASAEGALDPVSSWPGGETLTLVVGGWLQDALNAGRYLEVRLRFEVESDGDGAEDTVKPATGEDGDHPPRLEIGYYAP